MSGALTIAGIGALRDILDSVGVSGVMVWCWVLSLGTLGTSGVSVGGSGRGSNPGGTGMLVGWVLFWKISANWCNACRWSLVMGANVSVAVGLESAVTRSLAAAIASDVLVVVGMVTVVGNHARVSAIRSAFVSLA